MNVEVGWFHNSPQFLTLPEREFLAALCSRAPQWSAFGLTPADSFLQYPGSLSLDVCDRTDGRDCVIRSLQIDFGGDEVVCGEAEPHQILMPLNAASSGVQSYGGAETTPAERARFAADWLKVELSRAIELREWHTAMFRHRRYIFADTKVCLCWIDSRNIGRSESEMGTPDGVRVVHPL